jgi:endonuclease III
MTEENEIVQIVNKMGLKNVKTARILRKACRLLTELRGWRAETEQRLKELYNSPELLADVIRKYW